MHVVTTPEKPKELHFKKLISHKSYNIERQGEKERETMSEFVPASMKNDPKSKLKEAAKTSYWSPSGKKTTKPDATDDWQETLRKIEKNKAEKAARRREQNAKNASILARMGSTTSTSSTESTKKTSPTLRPAASPFVVKKNLMSNVPSFATPTSVLRGGPIHSSPKVSKVPKVAEFVPGQGMTYGNQQQQKQQQQSYTPPTVPAEYHNFNTFKESIPSAKPVNLQSLYLPEQYRQYYQVQSVMTHSQVPAGSEVIKEVRC